MKLYEFLPQLRERSVFIGRETAALDEYPHIIRNLHMFWGYDEFYGYIDKLSFADRDRAGFPPIVIMEIEDIAELHRAKFPLLKGSTVKLNDSYFR